MDFVVVGLGLGALAILAGVILSGWTAPRATSELGAAAASDAGHLGLAAGGAIMLATIGALAGGLDDRTGAFLVATTATVAALGFLLWVYLNHSRIPWLAPRSRVRRTPAVAPVVAPVVAAASPSPSAGAAADPLLAVAESGTEPAAGREIADAAIDDDPPEPLAAAPFAADAGIAAWDDLFVADDDDGPDGRQEAVILGGTARRATDDA